MSHPFPELTAGEAAGRIEDGMTVGFSGFTPAGAAKAVPSALAERARRLHGDGATYPSSRPLRERINAQQTRFGFVRNAYLSIMVCPSVAKGGAISRVVPMATHVDHNEHSLQVLVTGSMLPDVHPEPED